MDGRVQQPVIDYLRAQCGVDYVDMITEPGPNRILAEGTDKTMVESIKKRVAISVEKHGSKTIAVTGHYDCAGNPAQEERQKQHLRTAAQVIGAWGFPVTRIIALWLDENFEPKGVS